MRLAVEYFAVYLHDAKNLSFKCRIACILSAFLMEGLWLWKAATGEQLHVRLNLNEAVNGAITKDYQRMNVLPALVTV